MYRIIDIRRSKKKLVNEIYLKREIDIKKLRQKRCYLTQRERNKWIGLDDFIFCSFLRQVLRGDRRRDSFNSPISQAANDRRHAAMHHATYNYVIHLKISKGEQDEKNMVENKKNI
ncbi:hypothetical protein EIM92_06720 [Paenibacillus lentus]|uniref:Uncharacterized protein n=1 Tax=Paenibacillus lentus TaxID=1338368 RepID=A0A3S8RSN7_9BACL|nr:hypothetical protein EIM92_06720 [Paenibacillus lentus]